MFLTNSVQLTRHHYHSQITDAILKAKEKLKSLCVHEVLYNNEKDGVLAISAVDRDTEREGEREGERGRDAIRAQEGQGLGSKGQSMGQKLCMKIVAEKVRLLIARFDII